MNDDVELTQEERLRDLAEAYVQLRESIRGSADPAKASAMAHLSIAMSLIEREGYAEGEYEEEEDDEEEDEV
jgi:hypothetical protein